MDVRTSILPILLRLNDSIKYRHPSVFDKDLFEECTKQICDTIESIEKDAGDWQNKWKALSLLMQTGIDVNLHIQEGVKPEHYRGRTTVITADEIKGSATKVVYFKIAILSHMRAAFITSIPHDAIKDIIYKTIEQDIWLADGMKRVCEFIDRGKLGKQEPIPAQPVFYCTEEERIFLDEYKNVINSSPEIEDKYPKIEDKQPTSFVASKSTTEQIIQFVRSKLPRKAK